MDSKLGPQRYFPGAREPGRKLEPCPRRHCGAKVKFLHHGFMHYSLFTQHMSLACCCWLLSLGLVVTPRASSLCSGPLSANSPAKRKNGVVVTHSSLQVATLSLTCTCIRQFLLPLLISDPPTRVKTPSGPVARVIARHLNHLPSAIGLLPLNSCTCILCLHFPLHLLHPQSITCFAGLLACCWPARLPRSLTLLRSCHFTSLVVPPSFPPGSGSD